jgi:SAM-dependent methyltransferase
MDEDRVRWNTKYAEQPVQGTSARIIKTYYPLAPVGVALDIAAGLGRNAVFLAQRGFRVEAVDISDVAIRHLAGRHPRLNPICVDLDGFQIPGQRYSLIANINFLDRRLFPAISDGLVPGGVLIFETFLKGSTSLEGKPTNPDHYLQPNELLHAFLELDVIYYHEAPSLRPHCPEHIASLVARKPHVP